MLADDSKEFNCKIITLIQPLESRFSRCLSKVVALAPLAANQPRLEMSNSESDGPSENEWDDRGELAWNEFDWENYLREQDDILSRYLAFYEKFSGRSDRIDHVAHLMGWDQESWGGDDEDPPHGNKEGVTLEAEPKEEFGEAGENADFEDSDPYTLHKNPIFIATKAIYQALKNAWWRLASESSRIPQSLAMSFHGSLFRGEEQATLAIQALDFGDYALAISLFKRALRELNQSFSLLSERRTDENKFVVNARGDLFPKLFDLREIWLRVMSECREELERPSEDED